LDFSDLPSPRLFKLVKLHFNLKINPYKLLYRTSYLTKKSFLLTWNAFKKYSEEINTNYLFTKLSLRSLKVLFKCKLIEKFFGKLKRNKMLLKFVNLSKLIGIDLIDFYHWLFYINEYNIYFNYDTKNFLIYVL